MRVHCAFEVAGNDHSVKRGGKENGSATDGKLVDVRWRFRKRQHVSTQRSEKQRRYGMIRHDKQPAQTKWGSKDGRKRWLYNKM
jgi:hypothetical protein